MNEFSPIANVIPHIGEAGLLIELVVSPALQDIRFQLRKNCSVRNRIEDSVFNDAQGLPDIFIQSGDADGRNSIAGRQDLIASQFVQILVDLLCATGRSSKIRKIIQGKRQARVVLAAHVENHPDLGDVIDVILLVKQLDVLF